MAYRYRGRFFQVDTDNLSAEGICDRCGFRFNLKDLAWQYSFQGSFSLQNTRILTCQRGTCNDPPNPQDAAYILPPDPVPVLNGRPEPYAIDETSWLSTQDGNVITDESGNPILTSIPNLDDAANTSNLVSSILAHAGSVAVAYLDLFNGNPLSGGYSVLSAITGSSVRTNIASLLTTTSGIATNTSPIVVSAASTAVTNISYVGIYSASVSGSLLMSGTVSASPTIALGNPVQFPALGLSINLN